MIDDLKQQEGMNRVHRARSGCGDAYRPAGAILALLAIFLPGLLLVVGVLPFWGMLRESPNTRALFAGVNASVVGILVAALYQPVWTTAVIKPIDFVGAVAAFLGLEVWKLPPWCVVLGAVVIASMRYTLLRP